MAPGQEVQSAASGVRPLCWVARGAHLLYFAPSADALRSAARHGLHHSRSGVSPSRRGGDSVGMGRSGLRRGHGGDQGGLHQPLQVWAGGDGCHRGDEAGTGDGQLRAEVLKQNKKGKVEVSEEVSRQVERAGGNETASEASVSRTACAFL